MASASTKAAAPRVVQLDDGKLWRGGQHQVWLLMRELAARGVAQTLAGREGSPLAARTREIGVKVETVDYRGEIDFFAPRRIARIAREFNANILHAHTAHAHGAGLAAVRRLGEGVRLVTTRRVDFAVGRGYFSGRKYRVANQHFIAISEGVKRVLIEGGVPAEKIDVVFSGVPPLEKSGMPDREAARNAFGIAANEIAIANVGALTDHKGQRWLIEAAPRVLQAFPAARFHILGEGELRGELETQIARLGLHKQIVLHGHVPDARLKLAGFDLYVSSSHLEGLGTANLDAMLAGLPVVAAAAGGVTDVVIDGETGRLARARDGQSLAEAIIAALRDPQGSQAMAQRAKAWVAQQFSAAAMAEGTLRVYEKLLSKNF